MWLLSNSNNRIFVVVFVAWEAWDSNVNLLAGPGFFCIVVYSVLLQSCCPFSFNYQLGPEITQKINFQTHPWGIFLASGRACGGHVDWINWDWKTHSKGGRHHFLGWCHEMFYTKKKKSRWTQALPFSAGWLWLLCDMTPTHTVMDCQIKPILS